MKKQAVWYENLRRERKLRGLSQSEVATALQCDTKTVGRWERGEAFPSPYYVQRLTHFFQKDALTLGLFEDTLGSDTGEALPRSRAATLQPAEPATAMHTEQRLEIIPRHEEWGEAPYVEGFFGRDVEQELLRGWILEEGCRIVAFLGMGGAGKTTFARVIAEQLKSVFSSVHWFSLQNAPTPETYIRACLQHLEALTPTETLSFEASLARLLQCCAEKRCLLILDNVESILQGGEQAGRYRVGYEAYGQLLTHLGTHPHQSCLLLTSREKPKEITRLEGGSARVRSLVLPALGVAESQQLLQEKELIGSDAEWEALLRLYAGNPLALKLVSASIRELFDGSIGEFLREGEAIFEDISELLEQQFHRLSSLEQDLLQWLAIEREPVSLQTLSDDLVAPVAKGALLDTLNSLRRRSMVEISVEHRFTLQPVIMEFMIERLVELLFVCLRAGELAGCSGYAVLKAQASDYIRESQVRLIVQPLLKKLLAALGHTHCERHLRILLDRLREGEGLESGYGAGNIVNLLVELGANLQWLDCSSLTIRQAYLQGSDFAFVNLAHATLLNCALNDSFAWILCLAVSQDGRLLAAGTTVGTIRVWRTDDATPVLTCSGHSEEIRSLAFSPDGRYLASGSEDHTVRLWEVESGACQHILHGHRDQVRTVAYSPDGRYVASAGEDRLIYLWDAFSGHVASVLDGHSQRVRSLAFHPSLPLLASTGDETTVRLWDYAQGAHVATLAGPSQAVRVVAFSPDGRLLAAGSEDHTIRLWRTEDYEQVAVLQGQGSRVRTMHFSADSTLLASAGDDQMLNLWDMTSYQRIHQVHAHGNRIWSVVFVPNTTQLISTSEDDTIRWWDRHTMLCLRTLRGYTDLLKALAYSPDGCLLLSGSEDRTLRLWEVETGRSLRTLRGHQNRVRTVAYSQDGFTIASGSEDETVRLWDARTGHCLRILRAHTHLVRSVVFSADGSLLASGSHDLTVRVWEVATGQLLRRIEGITGYIWKVAFHPVTRQLACGTDDPVIRLWDSETGEVVREFTGHTHRVWAIEFSPDGRYLASCSDDLTLRVWDVASGACLRVIDGHTGWVRTLAFHPDGTLLATGSYDQTIRLWEAQTGRCLAVWRGHEGWIWSVTFRRDGAQLASCSDDGTIKLWDVASGACTRTLRSTRTYEGTNIYGVIGLSEAQREALHFLGAIEEQI